MEKRNLLSPSIVLMALTFVGAMKVTTTAPETYYSFVETKSASLETTEISKDAFQTNEEDQPDSDMSDKTCTSDEDMLLVIKKERQLLEEQRAQTEQKKSETQLLREKLAVEQQRLEELRSEISGLLQRIEDSQTEDLDRLITLYSSMKPQEAANIMNDMDLEVSVMILGKMDERSAAPIMAKMNPVRTQALSKIIFERAKLPGDQDLVGVKLK